MIDNPPKFDFQKYKDLPDAERLQRIEAARKELWELELSCSHPNVENVGSYEAASRDHDCCDFCGQPEERK